MLAGLQNFSSMGLRGSRRFLMSSRNSVKKFNKNYVWLWCLIFGKIRHEGRNFELTFYCFGILCSLGKNALRAEEVRSFMTVKIEEDKLEQVS